ncbi:MAG: Gfo/Idh/MocA family protein [Opitutaceae bacterium]
MAAPKTLRWGILSTARIGRKVWPSILLSGNGVVAAVASRDRAKAQAFIDENQAANPFPEAPRAIGSYEELLAAKDIDAVYVPLPTGIRRQWLIAAAAAGKHVVSEKPSAASLFDLQAILDACEHHGVQYMDGVMFMHGPRLQLLREALDDGRAFGELRRVTSTFSFCGDHAFLEKDIRLDSSMEPLGCLGDLGWYCVRFSLWAGKWALPRTVKGRILRSARRADAAGSDQVPLAFSGELLFDGWSAAFYCSFDSHLQNWAYVEGTAGIVRLEDFAFQQTGRRAQFWKGTEPIATDQYGDPHPKGQATHLYRTFAGLVLSGRRDPFWPEVSWKTQRVLDACLRSAQTGADAALG